LKQLVSLLAGFQAIALLGIADWVVATWNNPEWVILWIPQSILQWSLIGAIAGALYRLSSFPRLSAREKATLYLWIIAKPFVSTAFGCVVYLMVVGGVLMLLKGDLAPNQTSTQENHKAENHKEKERLHRELLAAVAFFAAFSDRFALSALNRLSRP
jgi:phosphate/sulfate permease